MVVIETQAEIQVIVIFQPSEAVVKRIVNITSPRPGRRDPGPFAFHAGLGRRLGRGTCRYSDLGVQVSA
jgi:hypothetical protein